MHKVLIAEDDLMIADMIEAILLGHGYEVCGIARTVSEAVTLGLAHKPDLAVIDLRLADGGLGTDIAAQLGAIGRLGILYATGNMAQVILTAADGHACIAKPYSSADLLRAMEIVIEIMANGRAAPPFPRGFQVLHPSTDPDRAPPSGWQRLENP
jgi:DNA-binding response OmpR family regulator